MIAASIREFDENFQIQHPFYDQSKGLVNLVSKGRIVGITTYTVEEQAGDRIEKAILDELKMEKEDIRKDKEKFRIYSNLLDIIQRKFIENIRLMDRLYVDESKKLEILQNEVTPMYRGLLQKAIQRPEWTWSDSPLFKRLAIGLSKYERKKHDLKLKKLEDKSIIPDLTDQHILSEAIYLKRTRFPDYKFCIASCDNHFSGFKEPYEGIPREIEERFGIICDLPANLIQKFKGFK